MLNDNELFPAKFLNATNLPHPGGVVEIERVELQMIGTPPKRKAVVYFLGLEQGLPLNRINFSTLVGAYGRNENTWRGKSVALRKERVPFAGKMTDAVRVHIPEPQLGLSRDAS